MINFGKVLENKKLIKIREEELAQKDRITTQDLTGGYYSEKKIPGILAILFLLFIPICLLDLLFKSKYKFIFLNTLKNDLTLHLSQQLKPSLIIPRFNLLQTRIFLFPLKIYSHSIRQEWHFANDKIKHAIEVMCLRYILIFINLMQGKVFFVRDDYHGEPSMIASISLVIPEIILINFQHGSMNLFLIEESKIYPGQRASLQITHDKYTMETFSKCNLFNAEILLSNSCYSRKKIDYSQNIDLIFIGNNSPSFFQFSEFLASEIKKCSFIADCYYKPHPSEKLAASIHLKPKDRMDDYMLIADGFPKMFIGVSSTVLYDAAMAGYKIILVNNADLCALDSIENLAKFPIIRSAASAIEIISSTYLENQILFSSEGAENYDEIVEKIMLRCSTFHDLKETPHNY